MARATGLIAGQVTVRKRRQAPAPSIAAASCSSCGVFCSPASSATVVCGMPAQMPTTITAGSAVASAGQPVLAVAEAEVGERLVEDARVRVVDEPPHDADDDLGHRPRE